MVKLSLQQIKDWLDKMPGHKEVTIGFRSDGISLELRQLSLTLDKFYFQFSWEQLQQCNLDLLSMKLNEALEKMG